MRRLLNPQLPACNVSARGTGVSERSLQAASTARKVWSRPVVDTRRIQRGCQACPGGSDQPQEIQSVDSDSAWKAYLHANLRSLCNPSTSSSEVSGTRPNNSSESQVCKSEWDFDGDDRSIPSPCNLPVNESVTSSMSIQLWAVAAERAYQERPAINMLTGKAYWSELSQVYVILFGVGERETEGIYSLRALSNDGLPQETIIAFEDEEDAQRYAGLLEATMDHLPNVCSIPPQELLHFCMDAGYSCRLEQKGSLLIPPDFNVGVTDWERSLRLREGHWSVLEEEPAMQAQQRQQRTMYAADSAHSSRQYISWGQQHSHESAAPVQLSAHELDSIRARLERLLPRD